MREVGALEKKHERLDVSIRADMVEVIEAEGKNDQSSSTKQERRF